MIRKLRSSTLPLLLAALVGGGCAFSGQDFSEAAFEANATVSQSDALLAPGDQIQVQYMVNSEWDATVVVGADGKASFPFVEDVPVAGLTLGQLDNNLEAIYEEKLEFPEVTLNILAYGGREVVVMGEVNLPGAVPFVSDRLTLIEAIGRAGGPIKETALLKQVMLVRWLPREGRRRSWTIDARQKYWDGPDEIYLQPYDVIFIPNTPIDDVDIWVDQYIRRMIPLPTIIPPAT